ncbi:MAG TPA: hypothetical protein VN901_13180 [Candidatus Acidoferrales bacterium]|nr:hypothetical protein [Candidatus Acidoferrales bacterium]
MSQRDRIISGWEDRQWAQTAGSEAGCGSSECTDINIKDGLAVPISGSALALP